MGVYTQRNSIPFTKVLSSCRLMMALLVLVQAMLVSSADFMTTSKQPIAIKLLRSLKDIKTPERSEEATFRSSRYASEIRKNLSSKPTKGQATDASGMVEKKQDDNADFHEQGRFSGRKRNLEMNNFNEVAREEFWNGKLSHVKLLRSLREEKIPERSEEATFRGSQYTSERRRNLSSKPTKREVMDASGMMEKKQDERVEFHEQGRFSGRKRNLARNKPENEEEFALKGWIWDTADQEDQQRLRKQGGNAGVRDQWRFGGRKRNTGGNR